MKTKNEEYEALKKNALAQFKTSHPLLGKYGAFAPLHKQILESVLEAENDMHLGDEERSKGNRKNGTGKKVLKTSQVGFELETPRDRESIFEPTPSRCPPGDHGGGVKLRRNNHLKLFLQDTLMSARVRLPQTLSANEECAPDRVPAFHYFWHRLRLQLLN